MSLRRQQRAVNSSQHGVSAAGQLVIRFLAVTSWPCYELTGSRDRAIGLELWLGLVLTSFVKAPSSDCQPDFQLATDLSLAIFGRLRTNRRFTTSTDLVLLHLNNWIFTAFL